MVVHNTRTISLHGLLLCLLLSPASGCLLQRQDADDITNFTNLEKQLKLFVDKTFSRDSYNIMDGVSIRRLDTNSNDSVLEEDKCEERRSGVSFEEYVQNKFEKYVRTHVLSVQVTKGRFFKFGTGKSSFLTGFGLGFLAFGLKKLLLPMFIGAQIVKSVLIAMFLPSILGSLGKLVGKGIGQASSLSGSSNHQPAPIDDFDFKDTGMPYNAEGTQDEYAAVAVPDFNFQPAPATTTTSTATQQAMSRFGNGEYYQKKHQVSYAAPHSDQYYFRRPNKQHDYKVFHKIPSSSMLLTTYDPFYSPLLSRLDAVFQQLGLVDGKGLQVERCRERLVCLMYANPTKYAPYSNLVSAQLSRELNELRKPSSDNPEILRFFRYMKAAKDGQDEACQAHTGCPGLQANKPNPVMLTTYNDINKLVQARKLH